MSIDISTSALHDTREQQLSATKFTLFIALGFVAFYNTSFFGAILNLTDYTSLQGAIFIVNISLVLWLLTFIVISLFTLPYLIKLVLPILFIASASIAYFMNTYGVVIHRLMIQSILETDFSETRNLFNIRLALYIFALGIMPSLLVLKIDIAY